ncbi:MAG: hypothetical protein Terrestrivirus1_325 [Terrestrivirus sp.]|uniref:Uncharacterized protein n=1 Tax=Terrestrivirus sp. TaxID=2487775 RepID=A0A3G4ZN97_9VIRU|nr:MAG: hypothetical protein Terrestrivirus1_325 [Terrestrivirus sp.]
MSTTTNNVNLNIKERATNYMELIKDLEAKVRSLRNELKEVYGIWASSGLDNQHFVCYFYTQESAQKEVDKCGGKSTDPDNNWTWYYSVKKVTDLKNIDMFKLDNVPNHFPYCGW